MHRQKSINQSKCPFTALFNKFLKPRLHATICCQTVSQTGLTTG